CSPFMPTSSIRTCWPSSNPELGGRSHAPFFFCTRSNQAGPRLVQEGNRRRRRLDEEEHIMESQVSTKGLIAAVMLFAVTVAMHEAASAEPCWPGQHWNSFNQAVRARSLFVTREDDQRTVRAAQGPGSGRRQRPAIQMHDQPRPCGMQAVPA